MKGRPSGTVNNKKRIIFIITILLLHFGVVTIAATESDMVPFSQEERDYMAENPILYVTLDPDRFPIEFYNKKSGGYVVTPKS